MKQNYLVAVSMAAISAFTGCNKNLETIQTQDRNPDKAEIALSISGARNTKATVDGTSTENAINSVDIFVFFKGGEYDGQLDAYAHFESAPYSLSATTGDRSIYAIVNSEYAESVMSTISTKAELLAKTMSLGSQKTAGNEAGNFTMIGNCVCIAENSNALVAGANAITINVDRAVSRVRLLKVSRDFESSALASQTFSVDEIYLSNAVTKAGYDMEYTPTVDDFENKLGVPTAGYDTWFRRAVSANLADNASKDLTDVSYSLYAMPNPNSADSEDKPFTVRNTKLVVKASLNSKTAYYVVPLGELKSNTTYDIDELVITRPGSSDPEKKTEIASCTFTVQARPWTIVPIETESGKYVI